jgi:hypothetical protein
MVIPLAVRVFGRFHAGLWDGGIGRIASRRASARSGYLLQLNLVEPVDSPLDWPMGHSDDFQTVDSLVGCT